MATTITQKNAKLIKKLLNFFGILFLVSLIACNAKQEERASFNPNDYSLGTITLATGSELVTYVAKGEQKQTKGLSGVKGEDFYSDEAMLFYYENSGARRFWMPDTYFNLDIFFLDSELRVLDIERNMPAHPGRQEPPKIAQTRLIKAHHILEVKSSSPLAREIKIGDKLTWKSESGDLAEIE